MKTFKAIRSMALFAVLSLFVCLTSVGADSNDSALPNSKVVSLEIKNDFCENLFSDIYDELKLDRMYESQAPADYAGIYADENQNFVLCVTAGSEAKYEKQLNRIASKALEEKPFSPLKTNDEQLARVETKIFSYNILNDIQKALNDNLIDFKIQETALMQELNCVSITIADPSKKQLIINYLKQYVANFDERAIRFIESPYDSVEPTADMAYNGAKIYYVLFAVGYGTIGFNGSYTDPSGKIHYGVFTNGHVAPAGTSMKISAFKTVGTTYFSYIGGCLDVAFIEFNSGWSLTSRFLDANSGADIDRAATNDELFEGALTRKYGATTGKQDGKILSISAGATVDYSGGKKAINDCFTFSNKTEVGDSGGPVGKQQVRQTFKLYGLTFAVHEDTTTYGLGIKLRNIKSAYNINVYGSSGWS